VFRRSFGERGGRGRGGGESANEERSASWSGAGESRDDRGSAMATKSKRAGPLDLLREYNCEKLLDRVTLKEHKVEFEPVEGRGKTTFDRKAKTAYRYVRLASSRFLEIKS